MKNILILIIIGGLIYYGITLFSPTRAAVLDCIDIYKKQIPFRSALEDTPQGESGKIYCETKMKAIKNFSYCIYSTSQTEKIPRSANLYFDYERLFSTELNAIEFTIESHNKECKRYPQLQIN